MRMDADDIISNVKIEREIVTNKEENFSKYNIMLDSE